MSYDISLHDPETGDIVLLPEKHNLRGGTYAVGGTHAAELNITYNYSPYFYQTLGSEGIHSLYGKTGWEAMPLLAQAVNTLGTETDNDYWKSTPGNAGKALRDLLTLCQAAPDAIIRD